MMAGYYYRQLDREKRAVYDAMRTGMEALAPGIRVPKLTGQELSDIYLRLKLDTPLLFYVTSTGRRSPPGWTVWSAPWRERPTGRRSWPSTGLFWKTSGMIS